MSGGYLSIDSILAEEERVPVQFHAPAARLGHLDVSSGSTDIEDGHRLEVPIWLAETLASHHLVTIDLPRIFSQKMRDAMLAAPESVRLREKSPYFYEAGLRLATCSSSEEAARLPAAIQATLATRVLLILTKSANAGSSDPSKFVESLTDLEQRLFWAGHRATRDHLAWKQGKLAELRATAAATGGSGAGGSGGAAASAGVETEARSFTGVSYKRKRNPLGSSTAAIGGSR